MPAENASLQCPHIFQYQKALKKWECKNKMSQWVVKSLPFKRQPHKMVKHTQTIRRLLLMNSLSVFGHSVGLALKGLNLSTYSDQFKIWYCYLTDSKSQFSLLNIKRNFLEIYKKYIYFWKFWKMFRKCLLPAISVSWIAAKEVVSTNWFVQFCFEIIKLS